MLVWVKEITDQVLAEARVASGASFKLIVSGTIVPREAGVAAAASVFWDPGCDGVVSHSLATDSMICVLNIFGCAV